MPTTENFLNLVDSEGQPVNAVVTRGVYHAYTKMTREYPGVDCALISNWAEEIACHMQEKCPDIKYPGGYASNRLKWMIFNYFNLKSSQLETVGTGDELETTTHASSAYSFQHDSEYRMFLGRVRADLDDRENLILSLLLNGYTLPEMASILGLSYDHGRQLIAKLKDKIAVVCSYTERRADRRHCRKNEAA